MSIDHESARQSVAEIRKQGDPIDGQWLLRRFAPGNIVAGTEGAAMGIVLSPSPYWHLIDSALATPPFIVGGLAVSAGIYGGLAKLDQRRSHAREELQQDLRGALKEPVDLFRFKDGRQKSLALRWYGADDAQANTVVDTVTRFKHLVEFAEESDISHIAVDANWAATNLGGTEDVPVNIEVFGTIEDGDTLIGNKKRLPVEIQDQDAPDEVLFSTIEQAKNLAEALEVSSKDLMIGELIKRTGNPQLIQEYRLFQRTDGKSVGRLLQSARGNLELLLNQETTVITRGRSDEGVPTRDRLHLSRRLSGEYIQETSQPGPNAATKNSTFEIKSLLERFGARSLGDLTNIALRAKQSEVVQEEILAAIYLLALRRDNQQYDGTSALSKSNRGHEGDYDTLFQRLQEEPRSYWRNWKQRFRRPAPEDLPSIEYTRRRGFGRVVSTLSVFAIGAAITASAMYGADQGIEPTAQEHFDICYDLDVFDRYEDDLTITDDARWDRRIADCNAIYRDINPVGQLGIDLYNIPSYGRSDAAVATAETIYGVVGPDTLDAISPWLSNFLEGFATSDSFKDMPPTFFNGNFDQTFLSEAGNTDSNQTIYSITPLKGGSTTGYWYTKVFETLTVNNGDLSFVTSDAILPGDETIKLPSNHLSPTELDGTADYRVTTQYFSYFMRNTIAVLDGYQIVAAHVTDRNDPTLSFPLDTIQITSESNTYGYGLPEDAADQMRAAGIETPMFTYWLSPLPEGVGTTETGDHFIEELRMPTAASDAPGAQAEAIKDVSNTVKEALGLPENATPNEVAAAIQSKEYSFTPISDQNLNLTATASEDPYRMLEQIGVILATADKLNCNLASAAYILATAEDSLALNQAVGFRDNGDGSITQLEAHAWLVDEGNAIVDPTPAGTAAEAEATLPDPEPEDPRTVESHERSQQLLTGAALLAGLGTALTVWRNRRKLLAVRDSFKVKTATKSKHAPKAMQVVNHAIYGPTGEQLDWTTHTQTDNAPVSEQLRSSLHPMVKTDAREKLKAALANPSLTGAEKRAVRSLISAARAAHRLG
jgi:hypothetical protein